MHNNSKEIFQKENKVKNVVFIVEMRYQEETVFI